MDKWVGDTIRAGSYSGCVWWDSVSFTYGAFIEHVVGTKHGARYTALRVLRVLWTDKVTFQGQRRSRKMCGGTHWVLACGFREEGTLELNLQETSNCEKGDLEGGVAPLVPALLACQGPLCSFAGI